MDVEEARNRLSEMIETLSTAAAPFEVSFLKARVRHTSREPYPLDLMRTAAGLQLFFLRAQHHNALIGDTIERSEEHTSELQSLMRISYAVFCLKKKNKNTDKHIKQLYYNLNTI